MTISSRVKSSEGLNLFNLLPYDPEEYPREISRHYISATDSDIADMQSKIGITDLKDLFSHFPQESCFTTGPSLPAEMSYEEACKHLDSLANSTQLCPSFIGDLLPVWSVHQIVDEVSKLRPLTTSYTPYQPERSQGTLVTHWIYQ